MESEKVLTPTELTELYVQYKDALVDVDLAEMVHEQGRKDAGTWTANAQRRMDDAVSDVDALEINAFLASTMIADRYAIIGRLRSQERPVPWSKIGEILGMSKQAAQQWYDTYNLRPRIENPTRRTDSA
ncbi:hypothetical protein O4160_13625 [Rhodococcus sp. IEGM 1401]|uniref:hypothetical protein n=1 Tax=Nocardiaceae TaxID=85025 RepID=UPI00050C5128|nr:MULTISPECIES: hypothetical protein [Rhodococcus]MCJ0980592.1 hypothetical protein [Rhodococcus sp. ARC_M12]MCZ4561875.1 hypothetical protein [Rhodococcus sp. IEGM 1401]MDI9921948.1 hypothetical protein [Rhodococcus sp. IEGM 1372]MDV8034470.1 hypothetical protein [Rhodococcus sp. IEGM 1414]